VGRSCESVLPSFMEGPIGARGYRPNSPLGLVRQVWRLELEGVVVGRSRRSGRPRGTRTTARARGGTGHAGRSSRAPGQSSAGRENAEIPALTIRRSSMEVSTLWVSCSERRGPRNTERLRAMSDPPIKAQRDRCFTVSRHSAGVQDAGAIVFEKE